MKPFLSSFKLFVFVLAAFTTLFYTCREEPTKPPPPQNIDTTKTDTTSSNFDFQFFFFGEMDSDFYDVCIVNDTCIWAVGEIHMKDSLGNRDEYNGVRWDGTKWNLVKVPVPICGSNTTVPARLEYSFAFTQKNIWFCTGGVIIKWNGSQFVFDCSLVPLLFKWNGGINRLWAKSPTDAYFVGSNGLIVNWDGKEYRKIESDTNLEFYDIYGALDSTTGETVVLAVASNRQYMVETKVVRIQNDKVTVLPNKGLPWSSMGVWFQQQKEIYIVGDGIYHKKYNEMSQDSEWKHEYGVTKFYSRSGIGNASNDFFVCGAYGSLLHYNGKVWHSYSQVSAIFTAGALKRIAVINDLVCAVGYQGRSAAIVVGRRR